MSSYRVVAISAFLFLAFFAIIVNFESLSQSVFEVRWVEKYTHTQYYEFFLGLLTFIALTFVVFLTMRDKRLLYIWIIKGFVVTLVFMLFYEHYYHGMDTYYYAMRALIRHFPAINGTGTQNVASINSYFTLLVGKSFYSLKVFNAFIGFMGLLYLYKTYEYIMQKSGLKIDDRFIYIFFLFPSVLFWSSILGKDPLNLFFIGMFAYAFIHIIDAVKIRYVVMITVAMWGVSYIRSWWPAIMMTSIFLYYLKINSIKNFLLFLLVLPVFVVIALGLLKSQGIASFNDAFMKMTETAANLSGTGTALGSSVSVHAINGIGDYLLFYIPNLFTSLFRPMPWDIRNPFTAMAAVENVILLYLAYKYIFKHWKEIYRNKYLKFYILFIFSWSLLYVIISPTNLGIAVRFKLQVLPAMLILIGVAIAMSKQREREKEAAAGTATVKSVI